MGLLDAFDPNRDQPIHSGMFEGLITEDANNLKDQVTMKSNDLDGGQTVIGPCYWMPRIDGDNEVLMPKIGDRALVTFTNNEEAWIIAWWPLND